MKCWICGGEADSREHRIKVTDIRAMFGHVNPDKPLYLHTETDKTRRVHGIKSNRLKWDAPLCSRCNNEVSQPYDYAWQKLSDYFKQRAADIRKGRKIRLDRVFPGSVHRSMIDVQLYFAKWLGCLVIQESIPLDAAQFATAILNREPMPRLYLGFWECIALPGKRQLGSTPVHVKEVNGQVVWGTAFYDLGQFAINVIYAEPGRTIAGMTDAWHPDTGGKVLRIKGR